MARKRKPLKVKGKKFNSYSEILKSIDNLENGQIVHTINEGKPQHWIVETKKVKQNLVRVSPYFGKL